MITSPTLERVDLQLTPVAAEHPDGRMQSYMRVIGIRTAYEEVLNEEDAAVYSNVIRTSVRLPRWFSSRLVDSAVTLLSPDQQSTMTCHQFAAYMRTGETLDQEAAHLAAYEQGVVKGAQLTLSHELSIEPGAQEVIVRSGADATHDPNDVFHSMVASGVDATRFHVVGPNEGLAYDMAITPRSFYGDMLDKMACFVTNTVTASA